MKIASEKGALVSGGAVVAAFLASLCCIGPVLFVTLGIGAGLAAQFEPFRWPFTALAVALVLLGFYSVYGRAQARPDSQPDTVAGLSCEAPRNRSREKLVLWIATVIAVVLLTFPQWSLLLI